MTPPGRSLRLTRCLLAIPLLIAPLPALAYIDPNTGGMIFQVLAPILAAITSGWLFLRDRLKAIWHRLKGKLFRARKAPAASDHEAS